MKPGQRYVRGHNSRTRNAEARAKIATALRGRTAPESARRKMSESMKRVWETPEYRMKMVGENHASWKGGSRNSHRRRTRQAMETKLNRKLRHGEVIHHINFNNRDHHPDNVYVFSSQSAHTTFHRRIEKLGIIDHFRNWFSAA